MILLNGIGLGTFPFANPFTKVSEAEATKIVDTFIRNGGKYIDTSPTYSFGEVENLLGRILKKFNRDDFFINTSCGFIRSGDGFKKSGRYNDVIKDCDESLLRLGLDEIDLYISHTPDTETNTPFSETIAALEDLKKQGKIKGIGVSNVTLDQLKEYNETGSVRFVQNRFSLLNQSIEPNFSDYCIKENIGVVAFQVIERGLLTERILENITLESNDLRNRKPEFAVNIKTVIAKWVKEELLPVAKKHELPLTAIAIKWALSNEFISMCQCGATNEKQVLNNIKALNKTKSNIIQEINDAYIKLEKTLFNNYNKSVIDFLGINLKDTTGGSASGK
jgi:aryl-alcohol dehydrogenase-like predicted oxidoreductase